MDSYGSDKDAVEVYTSFGLGLEFLSRAHLREPDIKTIHQKGEIQRRISQKRGS